MNITVNIPNYLLNFFDNKDLNKTFYERYCEQALVILKPVSKYFELNIRKYIMRYIVTEYKPNDVLPFPAKCTIPGIFQRSSLILYFNALFLYHSNPKCGAYVQSFNDGITDWLEKCEENKFAYQITTTKDSIKICNRTFNGKNPHEIFFLMKFLEKYTRSQRLFKDINQEILYETHHFFDLLQLLKSYKAYDGIDIIIRSLVKKIIGYLKLKLEQELNDKSSEALLSIPQLLSDLLRSDIFSSKGYLDILMPLVIIEENLGSVNKMKLIGNLIKEDLTIADKEVLIVKNLAIQNIKDEKACSTIQYCALELLAILVKKNKISDLQEVIDVIECIKKNPSLETQEKAKDIMESIALNKHF